MHSLRNRLALLFFAITLTAIAIVYLYVVPPLESSLREEKLRTLEAASRQYADPIVSAVGTDVDARRLDSAVRQAADRASARVTLLAIYAREGQRLDSYYVSDSTDETELDDLFELAALQAARTRRTVTTTEPSSAGRLAEAARPLVKAGQVAYVLVLSQPLGDVHRNVVVVRERIVIAGTLALLMALLAGYLVARALSLRVKRLERAAEKVAAGDFSGTIRVDSDDELGQLALAFNQMQSQLAQLDDARKQFIATASHELRTPIFSLGGFVELLQDEELDEETREHFLEQLRQQVERLRTLSTELLDLSRLEAGSLELRPEPVDVGELARAVSMEFTPALARHDSHLELRLGQLEIPALCDRERVAQIMRILIDNALTHTPSGTDIVVTASRDNGALRLQVRDYGVGIKRTVIPRIFEPFFTSDDAQGAGLGLAIARELAERMEGRLDVESLPGRTTFTLELPA